MLNIGCSLKMVSLRVIEIQLSYFERLIGTRKNPGESCPDPAGHARSISFTREPTRRLHSETVPCFLLAGTLLIIFQSHRDCKDGSPSVCPKPSC